MNEALTLFLLWVGTYAGMWLAIGYGLRCRYLLEMHANIFRHAETKLQSSNERLRLENEDLRQRLRASVEAQTSTENALSMCQIRRDDWHRLADERAAEISRLHSLVMPRLEVDLSD